MARKNKKKNQPAAAIDSPIVKADDSGKMLVHKLSVKDARHMVQGEGELEPSQIVIRVISIMVVAAMCAYAIWKGNATAWHLALPMVAEYFALLVGIVVAFAIVQHRDMRKEARNAFMVLNGVAAINAISIYIRARRQEISWTERLELDLKESWAWISESHMQWPMLFAAVAVCLDLPVRVKNLLRYGPPFVAVGLGCGVRVGILFLGFFLLPFIVSGSKTSNAWILWGLIIGAELLALWMHWDIQGKLKKLDGASEAETTKN
jgi:hypothetical protein